MVLKYLVLITIMLLNLTSLEAQDFGCYEIRSDENAIYGHVLNSSFTIDFFTIDWEAYKPPSEFKNGYYERYKRGELKCDSLLLVKGYVDNGLQIGKWKYYINEDLVLEGEFNGHLKNGEWKLYFKRFHLEDTIFLQKVLFKNDEIQRISSFVFNNNSKVIVTEYKEKIKNGNELTYLLKQKDELELLGYKNFKSGVLEGEYLELSETKSRDTLVFGTFHKGLRVGKWIFKSDDNCRHIIDFIDGKANGVYLKKFPNHQLAWKVEMKNNLYYNVNEMYDSLGNSLEIGSFYNGNGNLIFYHPDGILQSSQEMKNQCIKGPVRSYYDKDILEYNGVVHSVISECNAKDIFNYFDNPTNFLLKTCDFQKGTDLTLFLQNNSMIKWNSTIQNEIEKEENLIHVEKYKNDICYNEYFELNSHRVGTRYCCKLDGRTDFIENYSIIDSFGFKKSVLEGPSYLFNKNGRLVNILNYAHDTLFGRSYFFDEYGNLGRINVIEKNGSSYSVYFNDTVNFIDSLGLKQGKWINMSPFQTGECNSVHALKFYKDNLPVGTWSYFSIFGNKLYSQKNFLNDSTASVKVFNNKGKIVAYGIEIQEVREGEWILKSSKKGKRKTVVNYECGKEISNQKRLW